MNTQEKLKIDDRIMKELGANVIRRLICNTNKGLLELVIRKGENNYFLSIDSVPLDKEVNDKLMDILFKPEVTVSPINNSTVIKTNGETNKKTKRVR